MYSCRDDLRRLLRLNSAPSTGSSTTRCSRRPGQAAPYERRIGRVRTRRRRSRSSSARCSAGWRDVDVTAGHVLPHRSVRAASRWSGSRAPTSRGCTGWPSRLACAAISPRPHRMTRRLQARRVCCSIALAVLVAQAVFEFGPLWLVALEVPAAAYGPYWAAPGDQKAAVGGYLDQQAAARPPGTGLSACSSPRRWPLISILLATQKLDVHRRGDRADRDDRWSWRSSASTPACSCTTRSPSSIRTGVSSGVGTLSWVLFLPFSLVLGWLHPRCTESTWPDGCCCPPSPASWPCCSPPQPAARLPPPAPACGEEAGPIDVGYHCSG